MKSVRSLLVALFVAMRAIFCMVPLNNVGPYPLEDLLYSMQEGSPETAMLATYAAAKILLPEVYLDHGKFLASPEVCTTLLLELRGLYMLLRVAEFSPIFERMDSDTDFYHHFKSLNSDSSFPHDVKYIIDELKKVPMPHFDRICSNSTIPGSFPFREDSNGILPLEERKLFSEMIPKIFFIYLLGNEVHIPEIMDKFLNRSLILPTYASDMETDETHVKANFKVVFQFLSDLHKRNRQLCHLAYKLFYLATIDDKDNSATLLFLFRKFAPDAIVITETIAVAFDSLQIAKYIREDCLPDDKRHELIRTGQLTLIRRD